MRHGLATVAGLAILAGCASAAASQEQVSGRITPSREYDQETLGSRGLEACRAFKAVRRHSDEMQAADHGRLTPGDTRRLATELAAAKRSAPRGLTPARCGVPL